jgi:hypothetical protein
MLGRLDAGRQPTGMPMLFGGSCSTGFGYNFDVHLLLGPIAELGDIEYPHQERETLQQSQVQAILILSISHNINKEYK